MRETKKRPSVKKTDHHFLVFFGQFFFFKKFVYEKCLARYVAKKKQDYTLLCHCPGANDDVLFNFSLRVRAPQTKISEQPDSYCSIFSFRRGRRKLLLLERVNNSSIITFRSSGDAGFSHVRTPSTSSGTGTLFPLGLQFFTGWPAGVEKAENE